MRGEQQLYRVVVHAGAEGARNDARLQLHDRIFVGYVRRDFGTLLLCFFAYQRCAVLPVTRCSPDVREDDGYNMQTI